MEQFISKQLNESLNGELNNLFERWKDSYQDENINDKVLMVWLSNIRMKKVVMI